MRLCTWHGRHHPITPATRRSRHRLSLTTLESRDVPAAWYTVHLDSAPQGTVGSTAASITSGNLHVNPAFDSTNSGTGLVFADSASDAIRKALTGGVVVNLSAVSLPPASYTFTPDTTTANAADHKAFAVTPTAASSTWKVYLEDLTADPAVSDWDYNDFYWTVSVGTGTAPASYAPTAAADIASTSLSTPVTVAVLANDHDAYGGTLAVVSAGVNGVTTHGTVAIAADGGSVVNTPNAGFSGTDSFSYTVDDGFGGQATALVTVTVHEQPLVTVTGPSSVVPDSNLPTATIPFTLHWVGVSAASSTVVLYRITVFDGEGFTNIVSQQTLSTTFLPGQTQFDSSLSLASVGTVRQVKIEVLPPGPGVPPPYTLDPNDSVFLCQVLMARPKLNGLYVGVKDDGATVSREDFERIMVNGKVGGVSVRNSPDVGILCVMLKTGAITADQVVAQKAADVKKFYDDAANNAAKGKQYEDAVDAMDYNTVKTVINKLSPSTINSLRLDTGCIGFVSCYTKTAEQFRTDWLAKVDAKAEKEALLSSMINATLPTQRSQDTPGARFFAKIEDAQAARKADGGTLITVQGERDPTSKTKPGEFDESTLAVDFANTNFNYSIYFAATDLWAYLDPKAADDPTKPSGQTVTLSKDFKPLPLVKTEVMFVLLPAAK